MKTPFFYFDNSEISRCVKKYSSRNFQLNYSVKACLFKGLVKFLDSFVDGFSVSSVNELEKVRLETKKPIHFVSPLIRQTEIDKINSFANSVSFNSLEQLDRFKLSLNSHIKVFLRVNPEISIISDKRYDPCREYSKLGIPLNDIRQYLSKNSCHSITGLQFHNACQEEDIEKILETLDKIRKTLDHFYHQFDSINLGGGCLYSKSNFDKLNKLNKQHFIIEPGFDLINSSGYLISSVVDLFKREEKNIAILDTSVNHLPEVFEYNFQPELIGSTEVSGYSCILAGASCLAGDVFGEYNLQNPIEVGSKIVFKNVGAYSFVKAHKFNGLEVPEIFMECHSIEDKVQIFNQNDHVLSLDYNFNIAKRNKCAI